MAEKLHLPKTPINNSDWESDVPDADYAIYGGDEKQEMQYISPESVSKESIKRIKARDLRNGHKILNLFTKDQKLAA